MGRRKDFINDIVKIYEKYNLSLTTEDEFIGFNIEAFKKENVDSLLETLTLNEDDISDILERLAEYFNKKSNILSNVLSHIKTKGYAESSDINILCEFGLPLRSEISFYLKIVPSETEVVIKEDGLDYDDTVEILKIIDKKLSTGQNKDY